jgi:hypothetical protein
MFPFPSLRLKTHGACAPYLAIEAYSVHVCQHLTSYGCRERRRIFLPFIFNVLETTSAPPAAGVLRQA